MFRLKLKGKECLACGICMDVCHRHAIALRPAKATPVEGDALTFLLLRTPRNFETPLQPKGTFPYLAQPELCDGCGDCVKECPTGALLLAIVEQGLAMGGSVERPAVH
ncbi:MAG TPA: 4Fe-4S dicluster domain-containing protein [Candidatus Dormibacteraeota bacterium]|nr:4Fe-4S dicluster domain-containing protein [Candidatus Dormibacteraeota bacterium]